MDVKKLYEELEPATSFLTGEDEAEEGCFIVDNELISVQNRDNMEENYHINKLFEDGLKVVALSKFRPSRIIGDVPNGESYEDLSPMCYESIARLEGATGVRWFDFDRDFPSYKDVVSCGLEKAQEIWENEGGVFALVSYTASDKEYLIWEEQMIVQWVLRGNPYLFEAISTTIFGAVNSLVSCIDGFFYDTEYGSVGVLSDVITMAETSKAYRLSNNIFTICLDEKAKVYEVLVEIMSVMKAQGKPLDDLLGINGFVKFFEEYDNDN